MIENLKKEIKEIEDSIDPKATKEELYEKLVKAYYKAKDIIELQDQINPIKDYSKELAATTADFEESQQRLQTVMKNEADVVADLGTTLEALDKATKALTKKEADATAVLMLIEDLYRTASAMEA